MFFLIKKKKREDTRSNNRNELQLQRKLLGKSLILAWRGNVFIALGKVYSLVVNYSVPYLVLILILADYFGGNV